MSLRLIIGGLLAGIVSFLMGWLIWGFLLHDSMSSLFVEFQATKVTIAGGAPMPLSRPEDAMVMWAMALSHLVIGYAYAYIISQSANPSAIGGMITGATVGLLFAVGYDLLFYSMTNMFVSGRTMITYDGIIGIITGGLMGVVAGWWLGRNKS